MRPDGLPSLFDLQVEAEAMDCRLVYAASNPLEEGMKIEDLKIPTEKDGRFPIVLESTRKICETIGQNIAIYGLITGPFTLALHLMGTAIFYEMIDEPENTHKLMNFCKDVCIATSEMYINAGVDIIAAVDPMTSQISPSNFADFVSPYITEVFEYIASRGKASSFFVCGNAKNNIEEMCKCKPNNVSIDENIPLEYVKEVCQKYGVSVGGNIKLTVTILFGTPTDNLNDAKNCMEIGGNTGFILSPGCDMPYATPAENVLAISSLVHGEESEFLEAASVLDGIEYNLPNYKEEKQVIIDVITLDSESCAPCQYMMEAVKTAAKDFGDKVKYIEHKIKQKESVVCMIKLGVKNLPTICIDREVKFISIISEVDKIKEAITEAANAKGI
ncbi:uroporphyrinogen decarboxylase family protein [Petroclostridium sp. X23]|uniref:uroporphyrinogen decarboxylase family protein n=1 Tax=Petroclostridium sp. X23 TaxID=3045146 RepID=UPI0024AE02CC|nr:uroporphyrinogen decarboxylase family protein [Petroclostridium sp. X23]WHH61763.1 uroporphyrinogen decarboxylase family protein [Petroclostridium sp. X23]